MWSLLRPLMLFTILYFIFVHFAGTIKGIHAPAVYLLLGIVLWNYFVEVTSGSVAAIVSKGDLLRKINFPKYVVIVAGSFGALINLGLNAIVIGFFMFLNHVPLTAHALLIIPLVAELFIVALGAAFLLSALFVKFRDVSYIWEIAMQAGFYLTPILYVITILPVKVSKILILNPLAQIIQDARHALVTTNTQTIAQLYPGKPWVWAVPVGIVLAIAVVGGLYFRKRSKSFAEEV
jgi:ABC-2 type transport system permease protein